MMHPIKSLKVSVAGIVAVLTFVCPLHAQTFDVTGTVIDSASSQALVNASVKIVEKPLVKGMTNASGAFSLSGGTGVIWTQTSKLLTHTIVIRGNVLTISSMEQGGIASVDVFSAAGIRVYHSELTARPGIDEEFTGLWHTPGFYYVNVRTGDENQVFACFGAITPNMASTAGTGGSTGRLAKQMASYTVEISKSGYVTKRVTVASEAADAGTIKLALVPGCPDAVVYDGETGNHPLALATTGAGFVYSGWPAVNKAKDTSGVAIVGNTCIRLALDPSGTCCGTFYFSWTNWNNGPGKAIDASNATALTLWIKILSGQYWNLQVYLSDSLGKSSWAGGADISIAPYVPGKNLDGTWRQATIPISAFNTNGINLSKVAGMAFEGDRKVTFLMDQIAFTYSTCK